MSKEILSKDELLIFFKKAEESYIEYCNSYNRYYELDGKERDTRSCIPIICE